MAKVLRLFARGSAIYWDREALEANARRFIGRTLDVKTGAWLPNKEPTEKDLDVISPLHAADYRMAVRHGDLWAADADTARECGIAFDDKYQAAMKADFADRDAALAEFDAIRVDLAKAVAAQAEADAKAAKQFEAGKISSGAK